MVDTDHNEEDVPDKEPRSSRGAARRGKGRVFVLGVLVGFVGDPFPGLDVTMELPLLLVDERLYVDAGYLAVVLLQVQLRLRPFRCYRQCQVLHEPQQYPDKDNN